MGMWQGPWHQGLREAKGGQRRREEEDRPQATGGRGRGGGFRHWEDRKINDPLANANHGEKGLLPTLEAKGTPQY